MILIGLLAVGLLSVARLLSRLSILIIELANRLLSELVLIACWILAVNRILLLVRLVLHLRVGHVCKFDIIGLV